MTSMNESLHHVYINHTLSKSLQTMLVKANEIMGQNQIPEKHRRFTSALFLTCNTITAPTEFVKTDMHVD